MAYSELIKSFAKIREYVSQFYIYGFKSRNEYTQKSARSYDNERRRIESWLGGFMQFHVNSNGKNVFLAVDSRVISRNPLYNAFKAKSFTQNDIMLHFYILDILNSTNPKPLKEIMDSITKDYLSVFDDDHTLDESTVRKKLREYEKAGIVKSEKRGRELVYYVAKDGVDLASWKNAAAYFSEEDPIGVIGSFLLDKYEDIPDFFAFKHHYILHALESEILEDIFIAMREHRSILLDIYVRRRGTVSEHTVLPLKIYISTQNGRRYVLGYHYGFRKTVFYRLDSIKKVKLLDTDSRYNEYLSFAEQFCEKIWGVSAGEKNSLDHIEMTVYAAQGEEYIVNRLEREKRCGHVEKAGNCMYKFTADVYDAMELMPWIRTFTGRIVKLECSNKSVEDTFYSDLDKMREMYGGKNGIQ